MSYIKRRWIGVSLVAWKSNPAWNCELQPQTFKRYSSFVILLSGGRQRICAKFPIFFLTISVGHGSSYVQIFVRYWKITKIIEQKLVLFNCSVLRFQLVEQFQDIFYTLIFHRHYPPVYTRAKAHENGLCSRSVTIESWTRDPCRGHRFNYKTEAF